MEKFWDIESTPITIDKNDRGDCIQVKKVTKNKKEFMDIRTWYVDKRGILMPSKGVVIPIELIPAVVQAVEVLKGGD